MTDKALVLRGPAGVGPVVEGEALVSQQGFSARYGAAGNLFQPGVVITSRMRSVEGRPLEVPPDVTPNAAQFEPPSADEAALVTRARDGDAGAYETLVQRYQELVFRTAYLITGHAAEAEDAAQDAFVKAYYSLDRFRADAPFRPWLLRIAANEARNRRIARGRRASLALRAADAEDPVSGDAAPSPEAAALRREEHQALLHALNGLRNDDRLVIAYRYFFDLTESEMAAALACAPGTVKSRLARALDRLRKGMRRG